MVVAQSGQRKSGGKLKFLNKVHDFGTVYRDTTLSARYTFVNVGTEPVHIRVGSSRLYVYEIRTESSGSYAGRFGLYHFVLEHGK